MSLQIGQKLGSYEITSLIGKGGMGEVYRARDSKLKRDVAIKALPEEFSRDRDRIIRFEREAEVLASLNHSNIASIYDLQEANDSRFLIMELVEGDTLAERIARGALPIEEALDIAKQICEALEAAHEKGIVHRDLKPGNVKITPDGKVKVLDFGLAKAYESEQPSPSLSNSPTISIAATNAGVILGTAAYMSPEQARGRAVDKRADVWSFGCVLYEMLSGQRAFTGEDVPDTLAAVMRGEPDWSTLPAGVPNTIRELLRRCLEKDRRKRAGDIAAALFAIDVLAHDTGSKEQDRAYISRETAAAQADAAALSVRREMSRTWRRRMAVLASSLVVVGATTGAGVWLATRPEPPRVVRTTIATSGAATLNISGASHDLAITPDGSHLVYRGSGGLIQRALDNLEPTILSSLVPTNIFISPDGQWVGFAAERALQKVSISGGPPVRLLPIGGALAGATWGSDGTIIYATAARDSGLWRISDAGGDPAVLTKPDRAHGELGHVNPEFLPGGHAVLFTIRTTEGSEATQIAVLDLRTGNIKVLVRGGSDARYIPTGYLLYNAGGSLRVAGFNLDRLEVSGTPVPVPESVLTTRAPLGAQAGTGSGAAVVASNGTLVYAPAGTLFGGQFGVPRSLVWVDRQGRETPIPLPPRTYSYPRFSPDGTRVVLDIRDEQSDLWIWELGRQNLTRLTFDPGSDFYPVWTPDGRRIIYYSSSNGGHVVWRPANGTGTVEQLTSLATNPNYTYSASPDGRSVAFQENMPKTGLDISLLVLDSKPRIEPLIQTQFAESNGEISPDGHWIAYQSNESGREEIYVRPFPKVDDGRWQVSISGGTRPAWARNGRELLYLDEDNLLTAVTVKTTPTFSASNPAPLLKTAYFSGFGGGGQAVAGRTYDVSPDGQRFLMIKEAGKDASTKDQVQVSLVVVQNWFEELKRLVPIKK
jgi:eukaryotic-like serine/threonine-protein kinase